MNSYSNQQNKRNVAFYIQLPFGEVFIEKGHGVTHPYHLVVLYYLVLCTCLCSFCGPSIHRISVQILGDHVDAKDPPSKQLTQFMAKTMNHANILNINPLLMS